jgi:CubicO group peptidase (beta-lactamase class C family)
LRNDGNSNVSVGKDSNGVAMPIINGYYNYAGGLKSTTTSMLDYMKMYLESNDKVVKQAMNRLAGDVRYGRAYAWNTYNYDKENKMLYHNGGTFGHSSWIALYPNQKIGIFLVTNIVTPDSQSKLNELSNSIINRITNWSN